MSMEERKKGQESKYALDKEQEFKVMARRNKLLGLWAAGELSYDDAKAEDYAKQVVLADFDEPGDEDVFRKVHEDFQAAGLEREDDIRAKMQELMGVATEQIMSDG